MRTAHHLMQGAALALLCAAALPAAAAVTGNGLMPASSANDAERGSRWQARISSTDSSQRMPLWNDGGLKPRSIGILGDYYFSRSTWIPRTVGGFRATGAMFLGNQTNDATSLARSGLYTLASGSGATAGLVVTPYAGLGYSATSARQGWGFSADLGLLSPRPAQAGRLVRPGANVQGFDDLLRDMRLAPLLQVGVSYSF